MDGNEGSGGIGDGVDRSEQFHRNEAISAVADDGFLGEEDDEYEDLYNDVNVGEGFLQSLRRNEDLGFRDVEAEKKVEPPPAVPPQQPVVESGGSIDGVGGGEDAGDEEMKLEKDDVGSRVSDRVESHQNVGFRGNDMGGTVLSGGSGTPGGGGLSVELRQPLGKVVELEDQTLNNSVLNQGMGQQLHAASVGTVRNSGNIAGNGTSLKQGGGNVNGAGGTVFGNGTGVGPGGGGGAVGGGSTLLFVGELHWWTTDAELEAQLCKYGPLKELKFFDEKASGKSKGYCQVEFYDPAAATACKEGMDGHVFNGRPCVVAFASPLGVKKMGEAQLNRNQQPQAALSQARRGPGDTIGKTGGISNTMGGNYQGGGDNNRAGGNYQGGGDNNRGYGRGNWGRGNAQGFGNRGPFGPMRNRPGGMGGRGIMGNGGNGFGQGIGAAPPLLHPQTMMGQGFDPAFGGPMGRMGYGGFPGAPTPPLSGILSSFPPVGSVGLPGVAPHVNPAFFGRGMPMNGMGMMPTTGLGGHNMGMWSDPSMGGWGGEEHGGRAGESSYGEEAMSEQYGDVIHDRGDWPNVMKEKDRGSERDWSGSSDRRYRDDREPGYDRDMAREKDMGHDHDWSERRNHEDRDVGREHSRDRGRDREHSRDRGRDRDRDRDRERDRDRHRDDKDRYADHHKYRDREAEYDDELDRGRSSRTYNKSRVLLEEEQRPRSRDAEYGKRRRLTSE